MTYLLERVQNTNNMDMSILTGPTGTRGQKPQQALSVRPKLGALVLLGGPSNAFEDEQDPAPMEY